MRACMHVCNICVCACMHACVHDYVSVGSVSLLVFGYLILCCCFCVVVSAVALSCFVCGGCLSCCDVWCFVVVVLSLFCCRYCCCCCCNCFVCHVFVVAQTLQVNLYPDQFNTTNSTMKAECHLDLGQDKANETECD